MHALLPSDHAPKIAAIAARLRSDHDGEVLAAGRLLVRELERHGVRPEDLVVRAAEHAQSAAPEAAAWAPFVRPRGVPDHVADALEALASDAAFSASEENFLQNMATRSRITDLQRAWLRDLLSRALIANAIAAVRREAAA